MDVDAGKVTELLLKIRKSREATAALVDELESLLAGEQTPGQIAKLLVDTFRARWSTANRGQTYVVSNYAAALAGMKKLLKDLSRDEILKRIDGYLASRDRFFVEGKHNLSTFISQINRFGSTPDLLGGEDKYRGITKGDKPDSGDSDADDIPF